MFLFGTTICLLIIVIVKIVPLNMVSYPRLLLMLLWGTPLRPLRLHSLPPAPKLILDVSLCVLFNLLLLLIQLTPPPLNLTLCIIKVN